MGTAGRTAPAMKKISVELKNCDLNYILAKFSFSQPQSRSFQLPLTLTSIAQDGGPGLTIGHQALGSLVWVGESRGQTWGEYNTDRDMNYCGGGGAGQWREMDSWLFSNMA